jgi:hypothetical protein
MNSRNFFQNIWEITLVGLVGWSYMNNVKVILYSSIGLFIMYLLTINFGGVKCYKKTYGWNQLCLGVVAMFYSFLLGCVALGYYINKYI